MAQWLYGYFGVCVSLPKEITVQIFESSVQPIKYSTEQNNKKHENIIRKNIDEIFDTIKNNHFNGRYLINHRINYMHLCDKINSIEEIIIGDEIKMNLMSLYILHVENHF